MLRRAALLRCSTHGLSDDYAALARHHARLVDQRQWELTSPSRALPVVGVLLRTGVVLEGLEAGGARSLAHLTPTMTRKERGLVRKLSEMLHNGNSQGAAQVSSSVGHEDDVVRSAYAQASRSGACSFLPQVDADFVKRLRSPASAFMLLELVQSPSIAVSWAGAAPRLTKEVVDAVCDLVGRDDGALALKAVLWLLLLLTGDEPINGPPVPASAGKRLFRLCVRRLHELLPELALQDMLHAYLQLSRAEVEYERPFIVVAEMEKLALAAPTEDYDAVSSGVLLRFMTTAFAVRHTELSLRLCAGWCAGSRVTDFSHEECLVAFAVVAALHERCPAEMAAAAAAPRDWEGVHDALFAQVFFVAGDMTPAACFRVLDQAELMNVSGWGITVPQTLLEKLKKRLLSECAAAAADEALSPDAAEELLRIVLGLRALLQRCTLLPSSAADVLAVAECVHLLERRVTAPCPL